MYFFLINAQAGNGRGGRVWRELEPVLAARGVRYRHAFTTSAAHAQACVREVLTAEPPQAIAVLGGDGTIHSVVPLLAASGVALAVIPAGSGNDTARGFGLPREPQAALEAMLAGRCVDIDLIDVSGELTLTALAIGFDAEIARTVNASRYKKWCNRLGIGQLAYIIALLQLLFRFRPDQVTITCDNQPAQVFERTWLIAVANVTSYGGGMQICPQAKTNDGYLDICVVHGCNAWQLLYLFPKVLTGQHVKLPFVSMLRTRSLTIHTELPLLAYGDGEPGTVTPLHAKNRHHSLQLIIPA